MMNFEDFVVAAVVDTEERNYGERVRLRGLRDVSNPFELAEVKFKKLFRLPRSSALHLCEVLDSYPQLNESGCIPKHLKILASLRFYADGSYLTADGEDSLIALSQPSMSRALEETTNAIVDVLAPQYIRFPLTLEEKETTMRDFQEKFNVPNVLGAIDCTHIAIFKPPNNDPLAPGSLFFNRKGYYSINCQVVTNSNGRIISVNPNFPGSTHDAAVWQASALAYHMKREFLQLGNERDQWLLGDKGYPLRPWLMTPLTEPENDEERQYNIHHARARNVVEMTFGALKNKLRCLHRHRTLHYKPEKAARIVIACCTLYNMYAEALPNEYDSDDDDSDDEESNHDAEPALNREPEAAANMENDENDYFTMGRAKRALLINNYRS